MINQPLPPAPAEGGGVIRIRAALAVLLVAIIAARSHSATSSIWVTSSPRRHTPRAPRVVFAAELEAGTVPGIREVKRRCRVGQDRAAAVQRELAVLIEGRMSAPGETMA